MKKQFHFVLQKKIGKTDVVLFLYLKNGKFFCDHYLHSTHLMNWFQAHWYWLLLNLPSWFKRNGNLFGYPKTAGKVYLKRLENTG